jgi:hypothetical protein
MKRLLIVAGICAVLGFGVLLVGAAVLLRPSPWDVQTMRSEDGVDRMFRVHRTDGRVETLTRNGWKPVTKPPVVAQNTLASEPLPPLSCAEYATIKRDRPGSVRNLDLFYQLPVDCP